MGTDQSHGACYSTSAARYLHPGSLPSTGACTASAVTPKVIRTQEPLGPCRCLASPASWVVRSPTAGRPIHCRYLPIDRCYSQAPLHPAASPSFVLPCPLPELAPLVPPWCSSDASAASYRCTLGLVAAGCIYGAVSVAATPGVVAMGWTVAAQRGRHNGGNPNGQSRRAEVACKPAQAERVRQVPPPAHACPRRPLRRPTGAPRRVPACTPARAPSMPVAGA